MTVSVRVNPLLERELELATGRQGVSKSQFIVRDFSRYRLPDGRPFEIL